MNPTTITTGEVRISYEHLTKPYAVSGKEDEAKYSCTLLIPKSDTATKQRIDAAIQKAIQDGVSSKWGGARPAQPPIPIWDGDGLRYKEVSWSESDYMDECEDWVKHNDPWWLSW